MKKLISKPVSILLMLTMLVSMFISMQSFIAFADTYATDFKASFESFKLNSSSRIVTVNEVTGLEENIIQFNKNGGTGTPEPGTDPVTDGTRGNNLKIVMPESGNKPQVNLYTKVENKCVFGVSIYITDGIGVSIAAKGNGNSWSTGVQNIVCATNGTLKVMSNKEENALENLQTGWYDIRIAPDFTTHKMCITIAKPDSTVNQYTKSFNSSSQGFDYLNITTSSTADVMVDDMSMFYDDPENEITYDKIHGGETACTVNFGKGVICADKTDFVEFYEGESALNPVVTPDFNNSYLKGFTLTFDEPLKSCTAYSFKLKGITGLFYNSLDGSYVVTEGKPEVSIVENITSDTMVICPTECKLGFEIETINTSGDEKSVYILNDGEAVEFEDAFSVNPVSGINELKVELRNDEGTTLATSQTVKFIGEVLTTEEVLTDDDFETGGRTLPIKGTGRRSDAEYKNKAYASVTGKTEENEYVKLDSYKDPTGETGALSYMQTNDAKNATAASHGDYNKIVSYEADYSFADFNASRELMRIKIYKDGEYSANLYAYAFLLDSDGQLWINSYSENTQKLIPVKTSEIKLNTWYSFRADYDLENHTCDMYFEDVCVAKDVQILKSQNAGLYNYVGYLNLNTGTPLTEDSITAIRVDNIYERYVERNEFEVLDVSYPSDSVADAVVVHDGKDKNVRFFTAVYCGDELKGITFKDLDLSGGRVHIVSNEIEGFVGENGIEYVTRSFFWNPETIEPFCVSK